MDAPITREELVHFAQQMMWLSLFAGAAGAALLAVVFEFFGSIFGWLFSRAEASARIKAARARAASGGMGPRPMLDSSRPADPHQRAGGELGRVSQAESQRPQAHAFVGRVVKRSDDPRPLSPDQAGPDSCLKDKRAEGVPVLRCAHGGSGDSGEVHGASNELTLAPVGPQTAMRGA